MATFLLPQMYLNATISCTTKLLKPLLVFAFCMAAGLAGLTQITQHRSHPIDVYVGYVIGAGIGVYLVSASRPDQRLQPSPEEKELQHLALPMLLDVCPVGDFFCFLFSL